MRSRLTAFVAATLLASLGHAGVVDAADPETGDPETGQRLYGRHCAACHVIAAPDGTTLMRGGVSGPNLFGIVGRQAGAVDGFARYGADLVAAGEAGLVWDAGTLDAYLTDPRAVMRTVLDNPRAGSRMVFRLRAEADRRDVIAYLKTLRAD